MEDAMKEGLSLLNKMMKEDEGVNKHLNTLPHNEEAQSVKITDITDE